MLTASRTLRKLAQMASQWQGIAVLPQQAFLADAVRD